MDIQGQCEPGFEPVSHIFQQHFSEGDEKGAAIAIWWKGQLVVNLWAGNRDKALEKPWNESTVVNVFSISKMISALCVQHAMDAGLIDIHRPVKDYWPAYGCENKGETTLAWMLNHRAALPAIRDEVPKEALFDWDYMAQRLAKEIPWWRPGEQHGYHMVTYGWLVGEAFKRQVGVTLGEYLKSEICEPRHLDIHLGISDSDIEVADLFGASGTPAEGRVHLFNEVISNPKGMTAKALSNPSTLMTSSNKPEWRKMELPSANIHCSAVSLATLMGLAVSDTGLISSTALKRLMTVESQGHDPVLTTQTRFGPGVMLQIADDPEASFGDVEQAFGHPGSGGALAFADPKNQVGFAYLMNQMGPYVMVDPRPKALSDTFYRCLSNI